MYDTIYGYSEDTLTLGYGFDYAARITTKPKTRVLHDQLTKQWLDNTRVAFVERDRDSVREATAPIEDICPVGIMEFIESDKYLNLKEMLFPACKWILKSFYEPQDCYEDFQLLWNNEEYVLPGFGTLGYTKEEVANLYFNRLIAMIGMRFGKSVISAIGVLYELYKLLSMPEPAIGPDWTLMKGTPITVSVGATSLDQSEGTIYSYIREWRDNSPWFSKYIECLKHYKIDGESAYHETDFQFEFLHKNIIVNAVHSKSSSLRGRTRQSIVLDEIAHFDDGAKNNAQNMWDALAFSTKNFNASSRIFAISSPVHISDMVNRLYAQCGVRFESPMYMDMGWRPISEYNGKRLPTDIHMLGFHYPTWEVNPRLPKTAFSQDFEINPEGTWRDIGALPSQAQEAFFSNPSKIDDMFTTNNCPVDDRGALSSTFRAKAGIKTYHLHVDVGAGKPSNFGMALGHSEHMPNAEGELIEMCVIDMAYAVEPDSNGEMDYVKAREILDEIIKRFPNIHYSSDRWNDLEYRQKIKKKVAKVESIVLDLEHYDELKNRIYADTIRCHRSGKLSEELKRLELVNGKRVEKGQGYTKDVADCVAAVTYRITDKQVNKLAVGRRVRGVYS